MRPASSSRMAHRRPPICSMPSTVASRRTCSTRAPSPRSRDCSASATSSRATTCSTSATAWRGRTRSCPCSTRPTDLAARKASARTAPTNRRTTAPMQDEAALRDDTGATYQPVVDFPVEGQQPIVRTASAQQPVLIAGDGEGLVGLASAGLIDGNELTQYAGAYARQPQQLLDAIDRDASLVVTDSNRRRGRRWSTVRDNVGYTEQAGEQPLRTDLTDNRLPVFPDATDDSSTVAEYPGGVSARASSYGNSISFTPEYRAANAVDGDLRTSWRTGASTDVRGEELDARLRAPGRHRPHPGHATPDRLPQPVDHRHRRSLRREGHDACSISTTRRDRRSGKSSRSRAGRSPRSS